MSATALTDAQREAVEHRGSPLIVLAGPGSGKTRVITSRVAHAIEQGEDPARVLVLTFSNKAARELKERLADLLDKDTAAMVRAGTFHWFGRTLLTRFAADAGLPSNPQIIDSSQRHSILSALLERGAGDGAHFPSARAGGVDAAIHETAVVIDALANRGLRPGDALAMAEETLGTGADSGHEAAWGRLAEICRLGIAYQDERRRLGLISFDDMILDSTRLLETSRQARDIVTGECRHVLVDEFQDVNRAQIEMLSRIRPPGSDAELAVVGDDDQSIYAFRGADTRAFPRFESVWQGARTVRLDENFRSAPEIVRASFAIIGLAGSRFDPEKSLRSAHEETGVGLIERVRLESEHNDGEAIATMLLAARAEDPERAWASSAVIARSHGDLARIAAACGLKGIPVHLDRVRAPIDDPGVRDLLCWIEALLDPGSAWAVIRLLARPPRSVPAATINCWLSAWRVSRSSARLEGAPDPGDLLAWVHARSVDDPEHAPGVALLHRTHAELSRRMAHEPADAMVESIIRECGLAHITLEGPRERAARVRALVQTLRFVRARMPRLDEPRDLRAFWSYYQALDQDESTFRSASPEDDYEGAPGGEDGAGSDAVRLLTAHASKGLEFDTVYLPRVNPPWGYPNSRDPAPEHSIPEGVLGEPASRADEERRLFYVACTRAERRLVLLAKIPKGKTKSTHYTLELADHGLLTSDRAEADVLAEPADPLRAEAQVWDRVAAEKRAARLDAAASLDRIEAAHGDRDAIGRAMDSLADAARRMGAIGAVAGGASYTPDEVTRELTRALLDQGRAPTGPVFRAPPPPLSLSYSAIDQYRRCPGCYYLKRVMGLPDQDSPVRVFGEAVHESLEVHARGIRDAEAEGREPPGLDGLLSIGRRVLLERMTRGERLTDADAGRLEAQLRAAWALHEAHESEILEIERRVEIPRELDGHTHTLVLKLDRIDRVDGGLRLVDYKAGKAWDRLREPKKDDLQMGMYAMALRTLFGDEVEGRAEYWVLSEGARGRIGLDQLSLAKTEKTIDETIRGVLAGRFEPDKDCDGLCWLLGDEAPQPTA